MIKAIYSINGTVTTKYKALKISEDYKNKKPNLIWIDIYLENHELEQEETLILSESFKFHEMSIEDCLFPQYPKIEEFGNYIFTAVHGIQLKPHYFQEFEDSIYELDIFIGKDFVVTVHAEELFFLETIFEKAKTRPQIEMKSLENLLYNIFNKVVSSYEFTLEKIDDKMENLEDDILEEPETVNMEEILNIKKVIFAMRKIAESQQTPYIYFTRPNNNLISKEHFVYFRDIYTQCAKMNQSITMRSQAVVSLLEVYMSSVTLRLTEAMKFLTVIATVLMPVLIISGYYGMNIKFPEYSIFGERELWIFAVCLMFVGIIAMLIYFKKKKWF
ncbi:cobalt/magnesium transport protein CorA [Endomicrobiia bacterium]|uniref:Mg2+/Co2+ transport protein CorA n=1 Tax=Endomicrobium trichonymphae TaxID=1408204 RepID=B1GZD4_ENDTX|nr:magnesium transporter CorA family protein [Candidatus Endomicrobium trichonymphae]GHT05336.1 cobalt/magnesium transport protein CorA [Endomicrobiia bacterium]BAG13616.1 putative Mg2+/Co2+ transport protein CorA [Candidatus Endomicrobium trichonymphae]BAV58693.1 putative Mg2+/Co2+ transport protein CorA [Candidatus Endomicrobium trichonymphae]GHT10301.1 cobalt/magnesium transport protein CorA [Endomicrobiia bacterium]GHT13963.1 cobalt/magnesium transport protein CorA [Endomicrobiia bacterium